MDTPKTTTGLSLREREDFRKIFEKRLEKVKAKTADVFAFKKVQQPSLIVNCALFTTFGLDPEVFPDDYYDDPAVMTNFQERSCFEQVQAIDDDFVPYLAPWFGTTIMASALGCKVEFPSKQDPAINPNHNPVKSPKDIRKLRIPDPEKDGLMPKVLEFLRFMRATSLLPVGITDSQGPLTTANQLMGYDKLIYLMEDEPTMMHELMDKITEALIQWHKKQKEVIGEPLTECTSDQQVYVGRHAGIWFSDDDAVLMSPKSYKEFVVPYNSRLLRAFGGGCLHYCGNATHQAENFLRTEGLVAINNYMLHDLDGFKKLKSRLEGRIVLFACDYAAVEYEPYFNELFDGLSITGLVVESQFTPLVGLVKGGKYIQVRRDSYEGREAIYKYLCRYFARPRSGHTRAN